MSIIHEILQIMELDNAQEELEKLFEQERKNIENFNNNQRKYEETLKQTNEKVLKKSMVNDLTTNKF